MRFYELWCKLGTSTFLFYVHSLLRSLYFRAGFSTVTLGLLVIIHTLFLLSKLWSTALCALAKNYCGKKEPEVIWNDNLVYVNNLLKSLYWKLFHLVNINFGQVVFQSNSDIALNYRYGFVIYWLSHYFVLVHQYACILIF